MKVEKMHVLIGKRNGDKAVLGVFSSAKRANDAREHIINGDAYYQEHLGCLWVEAFELNGQKMD